MAGLPRQFPDLAIHLTDQARTPIISSASALGETAPDECDAGSVSPTSGDVANPTRPTRQQRAQALDDLAATALRARDAAARLSLGADLPIAPLPSSSADTDGPETSTAALLAALGMTPPEHIVVTYNTGAVLIESFLDPRRRKERQTTHSAPGPTSSTASSRPASLSAGQDAATIPRRGNQVATNGTANSVDDDDDDTGRAPLLLGLVAAPDTRSLGDARRATARLERVGRAVQQELAAQQRR